jgi:hypothetical protein
MAVFRRSDEPLALALENLNRDPTIYLLSEAQNEEEVNASMASILRRDL